MGRGHIHFIGIGGIGVSALARLYRARGFVVSGSDVARSEVTDALRREDMRVHIGRQTGKHIPSATEAIVYSAAVRPDNPELREARRRGCATKTYAQALGELGQEFKTIAIAGAHGKSTVTALAALILIRGKRDPTVIVGTVIREFGGKNFRRGRSRWLVIEADEYRASFLNYAPHIAVVTNIDREHLDFYKSIAKIEGAFLDFLTRIRPGGTAILNRDDPRLRRIGAHLARARGDVNIVWYSLRDPAARKVKSVIRIPGRHNVSNALAARAVGRLLGVPDQKILSAIGAYRGAWRRFQYLGRVNEAVLIADYAHHPTEIRATLEATRERFPRGRIWCVFQPHHYERIQALFQEFIRAFDACDALILLDIYEVAGRERSRKSDAVSSAALASAVNRRGAPALYLPDPRRLKPFLRQALGRGDVLLMMGAGDIWEMTKELTRLN